MPVTLDNGLRAYCQILEPQTAERPLSISAAAGGCLLAKPISQLMRQVTEQFCAQLFVNVAICSRCHDSGSLPVFYLALGGERGSRSCCGSCRPGRAEFSRQCDHHWCTFTTRVLRLLMLLLLQWLSLVWTAESEAWNQPLTFWL